MGAKKFPQTFIRPDGKMDRSPFRTERMVRLKDKLSKPDELYVELKEWILTGNSLVIWCRINDLPYTTIRDWINNDEDRKKAFSEIKKESAHALVEDGLQLLKNAQADQRLDDPRAANAWVNLIRAEADYKRWMAGKYMKAEYGEESASAVTGIGNVTIIMNDTKTIEHEDIKIEDVNVEE